MKSQLLCTFTTCNLYKNVIEDISKYYNTELVFSKLFSLQNVNDSKEIFVTYNVQSDKDYLPKTISFHRIKEFNCLYTINALNQLIKDENDGILDKSFKIDWKKFNNSIIITNEVGIRIIQTKLIQIVTV